METPEAFVNAGAILAGAEILIDRRGIKPPVHQLPEGDGSVAVLLKAEISDLFICMVQNKELCLILMGHNGAPQFMERIKQTMWPTLRDDWQRGFPQYDLRDLELVYEFLFPGATRMILRWMKDDAGLSTEEIARRLDRLGHYCHLAIREF